jgi:hypothetical protein
MTQAVLHGFGEPSTPRTLTLPTPRGVCTLSPKVKGGVGLCLRVFNLKKDEARDLGLAPNAIGQVMRLMRSGHGDYLRKPAAQGEIQSSD